MDEPPLQESQSPSSTTTSLNSNSIAKDDSTLNFPFEIPQEIRNLTENEARELSHREYCLCDDDMIESWRKTFVLYSAFWQYHRNINALKFITNMGCPLAQIYSTYDKDEFYFNSREYLAGILTKQPHTQDISFLETLSNIDLLKLYRDIHMFNVVGFMKLATLPDEVRVQKNNNMRLNPNMLEEGRRKELVDIPAHTLEDNTQILINHIGVNSNMLLFACLQELLKRGNTSYILFSAQNTSFSAGLIGLGDLLIYKKAQETYLQKYGRVHIGKFKHSILIPHLELLIKNRQEQQGRDISLRGLDAEQTSLAEQTCENLIAMGDTIWAWNLAQSWQYKMEYLDSETPEFSECVAKTIYWLKKASEYEITKDAAHEALEWFQKRYSSQSEYS